LPEVRTRDTIGFALLAVLALQLTLYVGGCAGSKTRAVNVTAGEYYSEDEYESLSSGKRSDYCQQLTSEMAVSQKEYEAKQKEMQDTKDLIQSIRKQIVPIEQEVLQLESDIRSLNDKIDQVKALPKEWKIKLGDTLTLIAMQENVYNDIEKWWKIFEANQDKIADPWYIFPDTTLVIPRDWPAE
jgi:septal ring factor EnvC (AmiA/AmiB activator)